MENRDILLMIAKKRILNIMNMNMDLNQNMINRLIGVYHKINKIIAQDNNSHIKRETTTLRK